VANNPYDPDAESGHATCSSSDSEHEEGSGEVESPDTDRSFRRHIKKVLHTPTEYIYFAGLTFIGDIKLQPTTNHSRLLVISLAFWRYDRPCMMMKLWLVVFGCQ
jgi:hypothetical protein